MHIKLLNGEVKRYPYSLGLLYLDYPNTSFPSVLSNELLADYEVYPVTSTLPPDYDFSTQTVTEAAPALLDGTWTQQWAVRDLTAEELKARVPQAVARLQARLVLIGVGLWDAVTAYFQDPGRTAVELAFWEDAQTWRRDDATLIAAATALGLSEAQLDALFVQAVTL